MTGKKETTTAAQTPALEKNITEEQVADYLRAHPDFLSRNVDIVADQSAPDRWQQNGVVDMQHFMVALLQEEMDSLRTCAQDVIETGRNNMSNQFRTHKAILSILSAQDLDTALRTITDEWPLFLDVDTVALCFEPSPAHTSGLVSSHIHTLEVGGVGFVIDDRHEVQLFRKFNGPEAVFGSASDLVRSAAVGRIYEDKYMPAGLLALGSRTPDMFQPGQGIELLAFLTKVLSLVLHRWILPVEAPAEDA
jgi:uncharacterized protein YigA (DUF484 family)